MFDPTSPEPSLAEQRRYIYHLYKAGDLTAEGATVQLLRLDIDQLVRERELKRQAETTQEVA